MVLVQPIVSVEEEELLAPQHPAQSLAHYHGLVFTQRWRGHRLVKFIRFTEPVREDFIKLHPEWIALLDWTALKKPQADHFALTGIKLDAVVRTNFGALFIGVHRVLFALHHVVVDAVLGVWTLVLLSGKKPLVVCFVLCEEQRHITFAGQDEFA